MNTARCVVVVLGDVHLVAAARDHDLGCHVVGGGELLDGFGTERSEYRWAAPGLVPKLRNQTMEAVWLQRVKHQQPIFK